jgi:hypothetical protein
MIKEVIDRALPGVAGQLASLRSDRYTRSMVNDRPRTAQVDTITASAVNSTAYTITVDGIPVTYTSDGSASTAEIVAGLTAAIAAEGAINSKLVAAVTGAATMTLTARIAGVGFTTSVGANLSLANTTANDTADPIAFGDACFEAGARLCAVADSALFPARTADVALLTPTVANSTEYSVTITGPDNQGRTYAMTSDASATAKEIVDALTVLINAGQPADTVVATDDDAVLTLTAEATGYRFLVTTSSTLVAVFTAGTGNIDTVDTLNLFAGVALRDLARETPVSGGVVGYEGGAVVNVLNRGDVWVTTVDQAAVTSDVYVGVTSTAKGKFRASAASGYVKLPRTRARWEHAHSATLAVLTLL